MMQAITTPRCPADVLSWLAARGDDCRRGILETAEQLGPTRVSRCYDVGCWAYARVDPDGKSGQVCESLLAINLPAADSRVEVLDGRDFERVERLMRSMYADEATAAARLTQWKEKMAVREHCWSVDEIWDASVLASLLTLSPEARDGLIESARALRERHVPEPSWHFLCFADPRMLSPFVTKTMPECPSGTAMLVTDSDSFWSVAKIWVRAALQRRSRTSEEAAGGH